MKYYTTNNKRFIYNILVEGEERTVYKIFYDAQFAKKMGMKENSGGWVEKQDNLSQDGDCYISEDTILIGDCKITDNAIIVNSEITDNTIISGNAVVEDSKISGNTIITDNARVKNCVIYSAAFIGENATVIDSVLDKGFIIKGNNCLVNQVKTEKKDRGRVLE